MRAPLGRLEDVVESAAARQHERGMRGDKFDALLLETGRLCERPVAVFLVTEDDVLEDRFRDAELTWDLDVELGAFRRERPPLHGSKSSARALSQRKEQLTAVLSVDLSSYDSVPSRVFIDKLVFFFDTCSLLLATIRSPAVLWNRNMTSALTAESPAKAGSCTKAPPLVLGGRSPVVRYLRDSMIVCE